MPRSGRVNRRMPCESNVMCFSLKEARPRSCTLDPPGSMDLKYRHDKMRCRSMSGGGQVRIRAPTPRALPPTPAFALDLPPEADAHDGPVLEHVELIALAALALRVVGVERLVADQAGICDAVLHRIVERIAPDRLPGELAAHPEAAHEQLVAGRTLPPNP